MGFLVPLLWKQYRAEKYVLLFGFGTSFAIEVLQMFCGRTSDVDDLLMNTLGALIGYWMFLRQNGRLPSVCCGETKQRRQAWQYPALSIY